MKKLLITLIIACFSLGCAHASDVKNIQETLKTGETIDYPIRNNALIMILQPVPDGSGDYTMTICNKNSHCRQTSMLRNEIRYIGLFLEDINPVITAELKKNLTADKWNERQEAFREMYADYMNMYDKLFGKLESVKPSGIEYEVTN